MTTNEKLKELFKIELYCREHYLNDLDAKYYGDKLKELRNELKEEGINEFDYTPEEVMRIANE